MRHAPLTSDIHGSERRAGNERLSKRNSPIVADVVVCGRKTRHHIGYQGVHWHQPSQIRLRAIIVRQDVQDKFRIFRPLLDRRAGASAAAPLSPTLLPA